MRVLVTGATGYVGGKLTPLLLEAGHEVSVITRDPSGLVHAPWGSQVQVHQGDVREAATVARALEGIDAAYYLVHSMGAGASDFHQRDLDAARSFATAAATTGVSRIVYLSALGAPGPSLSPHLRSRHETGEALAEAGVPVLELRAGPVVGAGSLPFEMVRYLTERVPVMVCPRWVYTRVQPIGLDDMLTYLVKGMDVSFAGHRVVEVGGSEVLTYGEMMTRYASVRGLRRRMVRVPVLTPRLSSYWVRLVTPLRAGFAKHIVEGLRNEVVVREPNDTAALFPSVRPLGYEEAVQVALDGLRPPAFGASEPMPALGALTLRTQSSRGLIVEHRSMRCMAPPERLFEAIASVGGANGWYWDFGWRLRGALDRLVGGPGLRRTSHPRPALEPGAQLDFWRVEAVQPGRLLRLRAEMRLPGEAWLEMEVERGPDGGSVLRQRSWWAPKGLSGVVYWAVLLGVHRFVFNGMAHSLVRRAEEIDAAAGVDDAQVAP
ncbi:MAG: SDR family oxidoreductase [Chloroflexota bacterium]